MAEQVFSERRSRDSRKPSLSDCPEIAFYKCEECGDIYTKQGFKLEDKEFTCCNKSVKKLIPKSIEELPKDYELKYKITGGYNDNTVVINFKSDTLENRPEWICLKTFTGAYTKYILDKRKRELRFALADTDAFVYCDEDPCLECTFRCKRGFSIFMYNKNIGLFELPMDKFSPYWDSKNGNREV